MLTDWFRDVQIAWRVLARDRAFTAVAVLVLGMGIGIVNLQFVLVNAFCLRGLPIAEVDRVLFLAGRNAPTRDVPLSYREFDVIQRAAKSFASVAGYTNSSVVVGDEGRSPDRAAGTYVSATTFRVLRERPALGRDFAAADDQPGAPAVAVLGHDLWTTRYAADAAILGRTIRVNGIPTVVIGVMAAGFKFPSTTEIWQPLAAMPGLLSDQRATRSLSVIGRLQPSATMASAGAELNTLGERLAQDFPETNRDVRVAAMPINDRFNARITDPTWIAFISVGFIVLLVACANAANLLLMRSVRRGHEMAVRASLGASRLRLVRQLLTESAVLAMLGGVAGIALSLIGVRLISDMMPASTLPYFTHFSMDGRVLGVLCAVCLGTVFVFGLAPAAQVSRTDVRRVMAEGGRAGTGGVRSRRWTAVFLTTEFGLTMVMLAALALSVRVSRSAERAATVIDPTNMLTASIALSSERYRTPDARLAFYQQLDDRLAAIPGISAAAVTTDLPLAGAAPRRLTADGRTLVAGDSLLAYALRVSPRYFEALRLPLLQGRAFTTRDGSVGNETVIVNQHLAARLFPQGDAIGRRIRLADVASKDTGSAWLTIVGISPNVRQRSTPDPDPIVYVPMASAPPVAASLVLVGSSDDGSIIPLLRDAVRAIDADLPLYRVISMEQAMLDSQLLARLSNSLLTTIACVAVLLAAIGLYAVSAHAVMQRRKEIGVRMALGARRGTVAWMVVRRASVQLAFGLGAGVLATVAFEKLVGLGPGSFGYRMSDPLTMFGAAGILTAVTALACVAPAYRAAQLDPVQAIRND